MHHFSTKKPRRASDITGLLPRYRLVADFKRFAFSIQRKDNAADFTNLIFLFLGSESPSTSESTQELIQSIASPKSSKAHF